MWLSMLLFLMVVAVAWLPMMTMEKTAAASDYREQQAWYAAEAGYKRAVAQLEAGNSKWSWLSAAGGLTGEGNFGFSPNPSSLDLEKVNQDGVWYAVSIVDADEDILDGYKPKEGTVYTITAVGSYNGIRKVIRKEYTLGDNGGTGGGDEGGEETLKLPGLVQAGGKVTFANDGTGAIDGNIYVSDSGKVEDKTIGQLMEEMRQKAGAQNYHGHDYMDLQRFAENTRHMIIFDVLTHDSPVGWKGERTRLFLSDKGYEKALDSQAKGQIKILSHAKVRNGDLLYDRSEQIR